MNLRQHILLIGILFFCNTSYSKSDSTIILIEKKGIYLSPINLSNEFKIYSLTKYDTSKVKKYKEVKLNWIKSLKTDLSPSGLIIDTANLHGQFLVASNFNLPGNFFIYEDRSYLFNCGGSYLYPGNNFTLETFIRKWNGADYFLLKSTGIVTDSLIKIDLQVRNKKISTVTGAIPKIIMEGYFNEDGLSDFVLSEGNIFKMYLSKNSIYKPIDCRFIVGEIVPEF